MATILFSYGAKQTLVTTNFTTLGSGSGWQSAVIDNASTKYLDALFRFITKGQASSTLLLDVYAYAALGDGSYSDGATGTEGTFTAANRKNAAFVDSVQMFGTTSVTAVLKRTPAQAFGGILPDKYGLIVINNSGAALDGTAGSHVIEYEGISATSV